MHAARPPAGRTARHPRLGVIGVASGLIGATQYLLGVATTALLAVPATAGPGPW
ncbi:hypothetical protein [Kocuria himachalensis]